MSVPVTRPVSDHKQVVQQQGVIERTASPYFAPPVPAYMREPGTDYVTVISGNSSPAPMTKPSQLTPKQLRKIKRKG